MSKRPLQLASLIHRAVQSVISEGLSDPRLAETMVTITRVKVSDDLRSSTIMVSIMPEKAQSRAIHALRDAAGYIRRTASNRVSLQRMPELLFKLDATIKKQGQMMAAFEEVDRERRAATGESGDPGDSTEAISSQNDGEHH